MNSLLFLLKYAFTINPSIYIFSRNSPKQEWEGQGDSWKDTSATSTTKKKATAGGSDYARDWNNKLEDEAWEMLNN